MYMLWPNQNNHKYIRLTHLLTVVSRLVSSSGCLRTLSSYAAYFLVLCIRTSRNWWRSALPRLVRPGVHALLLCLFECIFLSWCLSLLVEICFPETEGAVGLCSSCRTGSFHWPVSPPSTVSSSAFSEFFSSPFISVISSPFISLIGFLCSSGQLLLHLLTEIFVLLLCLWHFHHVDTTLSNGPPTGILWSASPTGSSTRCTSKAATNKLVDVSILAVMASSF